MTVVNTIVRSIKVETMINVPIRSDVTYFVLINLVIPRSEKVNSMIQRLHLV